MGQHDHQDDDTGNNKRGHLYNRICFMSFVNSFRYFILCPKLLSYLAVASYTTKILSISSCFLGVIVL